jgi:ATP-dependent Clp protease ATP-binding subunit ClpC
MFEKFTETARKVIFHARYEASQFGCKQIDTEHLLLGVFRADQALTFRLLQAPEIQSIRERIEKQFPRREKVSTSMDIPVSQECKRVLTYAAEESTRLNDDYIATEHLLLGLLREHQCMASKVLVESGLTSVQLEQSLLPKSTTTPVSPRTEGLPDLASEASKGTPSPFVGREHELGRIIEVLSRRTRNNVVLIGEPGVGKNALVEGFAQRIADGAAPASLAGRPVLAIEAGSLLSAGEDKRLKDIVNHPNAILYVRGLFDLAAKGAGWGVLEAARLLEAHLSNAGSQCIATGTPMGLRRTLERAESLARHFEIVPILEPTEEEAIRIAGAWKQEYEKFHNVVIASEAIETAVTASRWFLRHRQLPDRAIDLLDDACARVKLRYESEPREIVEIRKRIRAITREMEKSITNHDFPKARDWSAIEREEQQNLQSALDQLKQDPPSNTVNAEDVLDALAVRARIPVTAVRRVLDVKPVDRLEVVWRELATQIPVGGHEWAEGLATWLAGSSSGDAEKLIQAIRTAMARLDSQDSQ